MNYVYLLPSRGLHGKTLFSCNLSRPVVEPNVNKLSCIYWVQDGMGQRVPNLDHAFDYGKCLSFSKQYNQGLAEEIQNLENDSQILICHDVETRNAMSVLDHKNIRLTVTFETLFGSHPPRVSSFEDFSQFLVYLNFIPFTAGAFLRILLFNAPDKVKLSFGTPPPMMGIQEFYTIRTRMSKATRVVNSCLLTSGSIKKKRRGEKKREKNLEPIAHSSKQIPLQPPHEDISDAEDPLKDEEYSLANLLKIDKRDLIPFEKSCFDDLNRAKMVGLGMGKKMPPYEPPQTVAENADSWESDSDME